MLPTPDTSHVPYTRVYEPAEDSFLLLDTLSSPSETAFLTSRFSSPSHLPNASASPSLKEETKPYSPLILEIGPGSGVVIAFLTAHATTIFGTSRGSGLLSLAVDLNRYACVATAMTAGKAVKDVPTSPGSGTAVSSGFFLDAVQGDLVSPLRLGQIDVLVFNPPYVPTEDLPVPVGPGEVMTRFEEDSRLLELSYAGGKDGMETTDRLIDALPEILSELGCAYLLLCAQNRPDEVKDRIRRFGPWWRAETVGRSGKQAGWEKLQIVRIWREGPP